MWVDLVCHFRKLYGVTSFAPKYTMLRHGQSASLAVANSIPTVFSESLNERPFVTRDERFFLMAVTRIGRTSTCDLSTLFNNRDYQA